MIHDCVVMLGKGGTITCASRLVLNHTGGSDIVINREHRYHVE